MGPFTLVLLAAAASAFNIGRDTNTCSPPHRYHWPGFDHLKYLFVFGDSYSTTGFVDYGTQPSPSDPLGNPPYYGYTASNGPNWVDFLTVQWNASLLETVDLAYGGATIDSNLVEPYLPTVQSVKVQVTEDFLPVYGAHNGSIDWRSDDTLFAFFDGINDVGDTWSTNYTNLYDEIFAEWAGLLDDVYNTGGRNFLFLQVPPVQRAPLNINNTAAEKLQEAEAIMDWNDRISSLDANFSSFYGDITSFVFDTYSLFDAVLDDPGISPITAPYLNTTDYCAAYEDGTATPYSFDATCGIPVDEYFWLNTLHPTFRMHNLTAMDLAKELAARPSNL